VLTHIGKHYGFASGAACSDFSLMSGPKKPGYFMAVQQGLDRSYP
jgi:hypothetical protein